VSPILTVALKFPPSSGTSSTRSFCPGPGLMSELAQRRSSPYAAGGTVVFFGFPNRNFGAREGKE